MRVQLARALGLVAGVVGIGSFTRAAYIPPAGFTRTAESFVGDAFAVAPDGKVAIGVANFSGGAELKVFASAADAQNNAAPLQTFTSAAYKAFGDVTFVNNDTLLYSENGGAASSDAVYRGTVSTGATSTVGSVPNAGGVIETGGRVYAAAANNPGTGALYEIVGGVASAVISNIGVGYLGGIAVDAAGNLLLTDTNDPSFSGNAGRLLRYSSTFAPLSPIDLAGGGGTGAYDVALDAEQDIFVTTGSTITRIANGTTAAEQFGSEFSGFPFITNLDYVGGGFEPNSGSGTLWVNAVFSDDGAIFGITPIPEPAAMGILAAGALALRRRRRMSRGTGASAVVASMLLFTAAANADQFFATQVISRTVGTQQQLAFTDPQSALGAPRGGGTITNGIDVYCLGNGGSLTLGFDNGVTGRGIFNGPGIDFIVSENSFYDNDDPTRAFAELMWVEVSSNNVNFARFPAYSANLVPVGPYGTINPAKVAQFGGANPVLANVDENLIDPFDPAAAGGDAFDLCALTSDPLVTGGLVDLNRIRYVRLVDVIGDGSSWDAVGRPIFDPTGVGIGGADVDSIAVINGTNTPEPASAALAGAAAVGVLRRRR